MLLVGCGLFLRTLMNLQAPAGRLRSERPDPRARVDPVSAGYKGDALGRAIVELTGRLAALPGVRASGLSENGLFSGTESGAPIEVEGFKSADEADLSARFDQAGPAYFTTPSGSR